MNVFLIVNLGAFTRHKSSQHTASMTALFPEELLDTIVKCIATDVVFIERQITLNHWKYASNKLLSLSVANHRLRRICLPYLFGDVKIDGGGGAARLEEQCIANEAFALAIR